MGLSLTPVTHNQNLKLPSQAEISYIRDYDKIRLQHTCSTPADNILSQLTVVAPGLPTALVRNWETTEVPEPVNSGY